GWRMLMECLAAGRAISLPSSSAAGAKSLLRNTSAYARIRKQFDLAIGKMEGLEEPLARMVENAYVIEAARAVTASMVSRGEEPGLEAFDAAFRGHVAFSLSSAFGAFFHNVTFGLFGAVPEKAYGTAEWYRQLWRASRNFAFVADLTVAVLGGGLKTKQKLT